MVRTYDTDGLRVNSRRAEEINAAQAAQHQQALQENQAAGTIVERQAAPVVSAQTQAAQQNAQLTDPTGGLIEQRREERLDGGVYAATGETRGPATAEQRAANEQNLKGIMNPGFGETAGLGLAELDRQINELTNAKPANHVADIANQQKLAALMEQKRVAVQAERDKAASSATAATESFDSTAPADGTQTPPQNPGASAVFQNLPPEFQFLGPIFEQMMSSFDEGAKQQQTLFDTVTGTQKKTFDDIDAKLSAMEARQTAVSEKVQGMLDRVRDQQEKFVTEQENAAKERLEWNRLREERRLYKARSDAVDAKIANMAVKNRMGSDGAIAEINAAGQFYDQALADLEVEVGVQRTDLAAKFTGLHNEVQTNYYNATLAEIKDFNAGIERISFQGIANTQARAAAEEKALTTLVTNTTALRTEAAKELMNIGLIVKQTIGEAKTEKRQKEADALAKIQYLASNFAPEEVADTIRSLAKDVTSFDASQLAGMAPLDVQAKLAKARATGGAGGGGFLPPQPRAPLLTQKEFLDQKIAEKEQQLNQSMSPEMRAEYLAANQANFAVEYQQAVSTVSSSSGSPEIDEAARLVVQGVIPNVAEAAKKLGLPYGAIAQQVAQMQNGSVTGGYTPMNDKQQKTFLKVAAAFDKDDVAKFARSVPNKVQTIVKSLDNRNGISDIAAINSLQNGIIDPGVSVREGDVDLIVQRAAPVIAKYSTDYWKNRLSKGGVIPEAERQHIKDLALELSRSITNVYQTTTYERLKRQGQALGLPEKNLAIFRDIDYSVPDFESEGTNDLESLLDSQGY